MQISREQARKSVGQVEETRQTLGTISNAVDVIDEMNQQNASAALEQSAVAEELAR